MTLWWKEALPLSPDLMRIVVRGVPWLGALGRAITVVILLDYTTLLQQSNLLIVPGPDGAVHTLRGGDVERTREGLTVWVRSTKT